MMGSYPTHATLAFSQLAQLGSFWSHLFLRRRQRLQALTLRKLLLWPTFALAPAPPSCLELPARPALRGGPSPCCSLVAGDGPEVATLRDGGESLSDRRSGEDCLNRLAGCICGEGREFSGIFFGTRREVPRANRGRRAEVDGLYSKLVLDPPLLAGIHSLSPTGFDLESDSGSLCLGEDEVDFDGLRNDGLGRLDAARRKTDR